MNRLNFLYIACFALTATLLLASCDDSVTVQPYPFDAPRYNWDIYTLRNNEIFTIWGYDTNCVIYQDMYSIIKYDGNSYNEIFVNNGYINTICGVNESYTYLGGGNFNIKPKIWKWNGQYLEDINVPDTTNIKYSLAWGYAISENDVWFGSHSGVLLNYSNGQFKFFYFDTSYSALPLFLDKNNNFYIFTYKDSLNYHGTEGKYWFDIYRKDNTNWIKVWSKVYVKEEPIVFRNSLNELFGIKEHSIFKFINDDFSLILNVNQFTMHYEIDGTSENDFMVKGFGLNGHTIEEFGFLHWNGKKWSFEYNTNFDINHGTRIRNIKKRYYCTVYNYPLGTYILKGTPKIRK